ncbi:MAG: EamA family transporter, partial [Clostridia bacterium]|nr:EamA family transporter [Clostridia bacterium]
LLMLRLRKNVPATRRDEPVAPKFIAMALACSLLNSVSATLDKVLMRTMSSSQLQFWSMFFLAALYTLFLAVRREKVDWKGSLKNGWIWLLSLLIIASDRMLFIANGMAASRLTVMTLLKQIGVVVTIVGGRLFFHEKDTLYKLLCAAVVVAGIVVAVL